MPTVAVTAPDGTAGTIDSSELAEAQAHGYKPAPAVAPMFRGQLPPEALHTQPEDVAGVDPTTAAKGFSLPVMLRDKTSGEARPVDPNDVPKLLASGSHEVADPTAKVQVVSPDGEVGSVDASELHDSLLKGGFHLPTDAELERQGITEQTRKDFGASEAAGVGLGAPLQSLADAVARATGYVPSLEHGLEKVSPEDLQRIQQVRGAAEEQHPLAYWAGRVPGEIGVLAGTGEAGRAIAGAAGATGLAKVAIEGATYAAEPAATAAINKDPAGAAEALALGVAGNLGLHAAFSAGAKVFGRTAEALAERGVGEAGAEERALAENKVLKDLGVPESKREAARAQLPDLLKAAGITSEDGQKEALQKITKLEESGGRIGKAMEALDAAPERESLLFDSLGKASKELEDVVATKVGPEAEQTAKVLKPIQEQLQAIASKADTSFTDTQALKTFIREQGVKFGGTETKLADRVRNDAYMIVKNNLEQAENAAAAQVGGSGVFEALKADRALYTLHKFFGDYAERKAGREVAESAMSHFHVARHGLAAMAGHLVGLPAPISVALSVGELALKNRLKNRVFGNAVKAIQGSTTPNTSLALDAIKALDTRVTQAAKGLFASLAGKEFATHASAVDSTIGHFIPGGGVGQSRAAQVHALRTAVNQHQDNPGGVADHMAALTAPLHEEGLAPVADAFTQHQLRLMKVIQAVLPKDPTMTNAHPFAPNVAPDDVSPATKARYERALTIAADPTKLLGLVKSNTISPADVAIAAATNPSTLAKMRAALVDEALKSKPDLSYQQRLSLGILMGQNIDQSTAQLPVLQDAFSAPPPLAGPAGPGKGGKAPELKGGSGKELAEAFLPDSAKGIVSSR